LKLNQIIAIEKGIKAKTQADVDAVFKLVQKPSATDGFVKTYKKKAEDEEDVPPSHQNVQISASKALQAIADRWVELFDVTAQKDFANCNARATVKVNDKPLLVDVPVTYLLFLEKQLTDLYTIVSKLPVLDPAEVWTLDSNSELYRTAPTLTTRTKKVQRGLVLHPPTVEHPAQTQLITEDVSVGTYEQVRYSGAMPNSERQIILARIVEAQNAVKAAREEANMIDAPRLSLGAAIFDFITGK